MPFIFRYKGFVIRFWYCFEERRRHVHAISDEANVKIWLEPEIAVASGKGRINQDRHALVGRPEEASLILRCTDPKHLGKAVHFV